MNTSSTEYIEDLNSDENVPDDDYANLVPWFTPEGTVNEDGKVVQVKKITINLFKFSKFLMSLGFYRFEKDREYFTVRIQNQIIQVASQTDVIDAVEDHIKSLKGGYLHSPKGKVKKDILLAKLFTGISTYFSENILNRCRKPKPFSFMEDTKTHAYFFFKNCIVKVSKDQIETFPYESVKDKFIWKDQILDRDFKRIKVVEFIDSPFAKFVENISGINQEINGSRLDQGRFDSLISIIGYNLHKYFEGKLKATILTDSTISEDANGRTGKTLLVKAMGKILNTDKNAKTFVELNGKNFNFRDPKRYQECELDTKLVHINDALNNFQFELLFNDISEGIKAVQHYKSPFLVLAKIILSTNRTIRIHGNSAKDRAIEFEMSNHYGISKSPEKEFGHWFFTDWNETQWLQFDNFMIYCVMQYLTYGIVEPRSINLNKRKLMEETAKEFVIFMDEYLKNNLEDKYEKKELYEKFINQYPDFNASASRSLRQRTFTKWCRRYATYKEGFIQCNEIRSNCKDWIVFIRVEPEDTPF